ncbi:MAG: 16S rRNA (guanine(966)-N(2))-methyltransferase RsmD [Candidatus Omnitrophica bacterium]|nr:16S rRNA (guanine(966)-N(2))-methyltransferase RsmD [Candidatus Omnitrophota bacterium]
MKIITGRYKGKNLVMPKGIRPTQNVVRKAIFDILGDISGLAFLELFAGTGAVGFEALSLGAAEVALVESNRGASEAIRKNIEGLKAQNCCLYPLEADEAIRVLHKEKKFFDVIFMDPPYYQDLPKKTLQTLSAYDILAPYGFLGVQHFKKDALPEEGQKLNLLKVSRYGDTFLTIYQKTEA